MGSGAVKKKKKISIITMNLYDTPAQARFINTYVPIQFEHLYRASESAKANIETGQMLLDKSAELESLGSLNPEANRLWNEEIYSPIKSFIDTEISDLASLNDPRKIAKLRGLIRSAAGSPLAKSLVESKEGYKATMDKADPRWGDTYLSMIQQHDPVSEGPWHKSPLPYRSWRELSEEYTKHLIPEVIARQGFNKVMGYKESSILTAINSNMGTISSDPSIALLAEHEFSRLPEETKAAYMQIDPETGEQSVNMTKFMRDAIYESAADKLMYRKEEIDQSAIQLRQLAVQEERLRMAKQAQAAKEAASSATAMWLNGAREAVSSNVLERALSMTASNRDMAVQQFGESPVKSFELLNQSNLAKRSLNAEIKGLLEQRAMLVSDERFKGMDRSARERDPEYRAINDKIESIRRAESLENERNIVYMEAALSSMANHTNMALVAPSETARRLEQLGPITPNSPASKVREAYGLYRQLNEEKSRVKLMYHAHQVEVPSHLSDLWGRNNIGDMVDLKMNVGGSSKGFMAKSTTNYRVADPNTLMIDPEYFMQSTRGVALVEEINNRLSSNNLGHDIVVIPQGRASMVGSRPRLFSYALIPESALKAGANPLSDSDIEDLYRRFGRVDGAPLLLNPSIYNQNYPATEGVRFLRIPITSDFISPDRSDVGNILVDRKVTPRTADNFNTAELFD